MSSDRTRESWLQRNWRPLSMLIFLALIVLDAAGVLAFRLDDRAWDVVEFGMGSYVVGRSAEKISQRIGVVVKAP